LGALKGNHGNFLKAIEAQFQAQESAHTVEQGHGRVERRSVSVFRDVDSLPGANQWAALKTVIRVKRYRHILKGRYILIKKPTTHYYISSLDESAQEFGQRIREYWQVENKVHYVRDVTQGEDASRIRIDPLPNILAIARNLALNLYRNHGCTNMAQAQRKAGQGLNFLKSLFRMK
jgi:predicted transposase YbfD/YdcC